MIKWLAIIAVWIVSLFAFWKLGGHNESQKNEIEKSKRRSEDVSRALIAGESARSLWLSKRK